MLTEISYKYKYEIGCRITAKKHILYFEHLKNKQIILRKEIIFCFVIFATTTVCEISDWLHIDCITNKATQRRNDKRKQECVAFCFYALYAPQQAAKLNGPRGGAPTVARRLFL